MAVIFRDGFDWYTASDFTKRWTAGGGSVNLSQSLARAPSGQGMSPTVNNASIYKSFGANYTQGLVGFAFLNTATNASRIVFTILDGTTEQISVRTNGSSVLTVNRGTTVLATGTTVLSQNTWYFIELKFTISNAAGVVELKLNGAAEIASTGSLDTTNTANVQWNGVAIQSAGTTFTSGQFDDLYVLDTSTGSNTNFLGPVRVVALPVVAPGNYAQWTANGGTNYGCVSEPWQDGDGSFNQSSTANQIDSFPIADLPASSGSVYNVDIIMVARQDAGAARTLASQARISSTDYTGSTQSLSTSYQFLEQSYDVSPATSTAWTPSEVAGMEIGYKLIS